MLELDGCQRAPGQVRGSQEERRLPAHQAEPQQAARGAQLRACVACLAGWRSERFSTATGVSCRQAGPCTCATSDPSLSHFLPASQLAGGYRVGETVYLAAAGKTFANGNRVEYGLRGKVMGPNLEDASRLDVKFEGNKGNLGCLPTWLSRSKPPEEVRTSACVCAGLGQ